MKRVVPSGYFEISRLDCIPIWGYVR